MKRNIPRLLNLYLKVLPKTFIRLEHNDSFPTTRIPSLNQKSPARSKQYPQTSVYQLPILDSAVPSPTNPKPPSDQLAESIKSAPSLKQLFEIVSMEEKYLEEHHVVLAFRSVHQLQNTHKTRYTPDALQNHVGFIKLCQHLRKVAPGMADSSDLVVCLKTLIFCQVSVNSRITQTILNVIKSRVNDLDLQQIIFLNFLLRKQKSPLADALTIALPVVFQSQLETQLEVDKLKQMCECLRYAIEHRMPASKVKFIVDSLLSYPSAWEASQLCSVIWSLARIRYLYEHGFLPLLNDSLNRFADKVDVCERKDLERTLLTMGDNCTLKSQYWYHENLCKKTADRVVRERWPLAETSLIGRAFSKLFYVDFDFLDYYSALIANSSENLPMHPYYILRPFAIANYKPPSFEKIVDLLLTPQNEVKDDREQPDYRFAVDFASLGLYPRNLIRQLFQEPFISSKLEKLRSDLDWLQIDALHRSVKIECPEYDGPFPSPSITEKCHRKIMEIGQRSQDSSVEKALQVALGGAQYVSSSLLTKSGHFIDHVLAMRPGGYPVAINLSVLDTESVRYVEDIDVTSGSQLVLIKVLRHNAYIANGDRLRGVHDLELRTLKRYGYDVVPLNLEKWENLLDYEKIPFLMQQVRLQEKSPVIS